MCLDQPIGNSREMQRPPVQPQHVAPPPESECIRDGPSSVRDNIMRPRLPRIPRANPMRRHRSKMAALLACSILHLGIVPITAQAAVDNPNNQFCGSSYDDARGQCQLPPGESLPCPDGEGDCEGYGLLCFEVDEECAAPASLEEEEHAEAGRDDTMVQGPEPAFSPEPLPLRSEDPTDHNFCGLGFDNLFGCAVPCPNGTPQECPQGQLCYFDTICDARFEGGARPVPTQAPTITPRPTERVAVLSDRNFCGESYTEASENCSSARHCPSGSNEECVEGMYCFVDVKGCDIGQLPTMRPTISPKPTFSPSVAPTTGNPAHTMAPTRSPLDADDIRNFFFCGVDWGDASTRCYKRCLSGEHFECPNGEECFAQAGCRHGEIKGGNGQAPAPAPAPAPEEKAPKESLAPGETWSPTPTPIQTDEPTHSPLQDDDIKKYFFCGKSWGDASERCYKRCLSGHHNECPEDEQCFAQADCKKGVITKRPTPEPTPMPVDGTISPTASSAPTNIPTEPKPTISPRPTSTPVDGFPTYSPTEPPVADCEGEPCFDKEHCRSAQGFCGPGGFYCNDLATWKASCDIVPTDPPVSAAPTTMLPSMSPSISTRPTTERTESPTDSPAGISDLVNDEVTGRPTVGAQEESIPSGESVEEGGGETSQPTPANVDDRYYEPGDPLGTFFCGTDWNHAITECPHRCPSGESNECPKGWSCYAFTSCVGVGINTPPTAKPTWEPTGRPTPTKPTAEPASPGTTPKPTRKPAWWTPEPSPKPSYAPTEDMCRGLPCDFEGECRSRLGFCGSGIVHCNSASAWIPSCGGGGAMIKLAETVSPNTVPTLSPSSSWEAWVGKKNEEEEAVESGATASDASDSDSGGSDSESDSGGAAQASGPGDGGASEGKDDAWEGFDPDAWDNWNTQNEPENDNKEPEDFRWWTTAHSASTKPTFSLSVAIAFLVLR